jgi:hypothetical protein
MAIDPKRVIEPTEPRFRVLKVVIPDGEDHYIVWDTCGHWHINEAQAEELEKTLNDLSEQWESPEMECHPELRDIHVQYLDSISGARGESE